MEFSRELGYWKDAQAKLLSCFYSCVLQSLFTYE